MKKSMLILTLMVAALCGCAAQQPTTLETPESSPDHYASIVSPNYSSMGIGCWFCSTEAGQYTYWAVTFQ